MELDRLEPADALKRRQEEARKRVAACRSSVCARELGCVVCAGAGWLTLPLAQVTAFTRQKSAASAEVREARDAVTTAQKKVTHLSVRPHCATTVCRLLSPTGR